MFDELNAIVDDFMNLPLVKECDSAKKAWEDYADEAYEETTENKLEALQEKLEALREEYMKSVEALDSFYSMDESDDREGKRERMTYYKGYIDALYKVRDDLRELLK